MSNGIRASLSAVEIMAENGAKGLQEDAQGRGTALHHHQVHYSRCMSVPIATARPPRLLGTTSCLLPAKHAALFPITMQVSFEPPKPIPMIAG